MPHTIAEFMTSPVHTIRSTSKLIEARRLMNELGVRHLPVFENHQLVGLVSDRDLNLVESLDGVSAEEVTVEEAMSQDAFVVAPETALAEVVHRMGAQKLGSAVVMEARKVVGIFTTVDACRALEAVLTEKPARKAAARKPGRMPVKKNAAARRAPIPVKAKRT